MEVDTITGLTSAKITNGNKAPRITTGSDLTREPSVTVTRGRREILADKTLTTSSLKTIKKASRPDTTGRQKRSSILKASLVPNRIHVNRLGPSSLQVNTAAAATSTAEAEGSPSAADKCLRAAFTTATMIRSSCRSSLTICKTKLSARPSLTKVWRKRFSNQRTLRLIIKT